MKLAGTICAKHTCSVRSTTTALSWTNTKLKALSQTMSLESPKVTNSNASVSHPEFIFTVLQLKNHLEASQKYQKGTNKLWLSIVVFPVFFVIKEEVAFVFTWCLLVSLSAAHCVKWNLPIAWLHRCACNSFHSCSWFQPFIQYSYFVLFSQNYYAKRHKDTLLFTLIVSGPFLTIIKANFISI